MQLVEQGKLALDDAKLVEKIALELKDVKVIVMESWLLRKVISH